MAILFIFHQGAWEKKKNSFKYIFKKLVWVKKKKKTQLVLPVQLYANLHVPSNVTLHDAYTV